MSNKRQLSLTIGKSGSVWYLKSRAAAWKAVDMPKGNLGLISSTGDMHSTEWVKTGAIPTVGGT
jgi:hypothetical protein